MMVNGVATQRIKMIAVDDEESILKLYSRILKTETLVLWNDTAENEHEQISEYEFKRPSGIITNGICFLVKAKHDRVKLSEEFDDFRWITKEELNDYDVIEYLKDEIEKVFSN